MPDRLIRAVFLALLAILAHPARGAPVPPNAEPMRVVVVRELTAECEPGCREWISAEGKIGPETPALFSAVLRKLGSRKLPILIQSSGGTIEAALAIGRMIRAKNLDVVVSRTTFVGCEPKDRVCAGAAGFPGFRGYPGSVGVANCASACPLVVAGGNRRFLIERYSYLGTHQVSQDVQRVLRHFRVRYEIRGGRKVEVSRALISVKPIAPPKKVGVAKTDAVYGQVGKYLETMGVSKNFVGLFFKAEFTDIYWLTPTDIGATGIAAQIGSIAVAFDGPEPRSPAEAAAPTAPPARPQIAPPVQSTPPVQVSQAQTSSPTDATPGRAEDQPGQNLATGYLRIGNERGVGVRLTLDFSVGTPDQLVDIDVFAERAGNRLSLAPMTLLLETNGAPPILARRAEGGSALTPLHATMRREDFCRLARRGAKTDVTLSLPEGSPGVQLSLSLTGAKILLLLSPEALQCGRFLDAPLL